MSPEPNSHWVSENSSFAQGLFACWLCNYVISLGHNSLAARVLPMKSMERNDEAARI